MSEIKVGSAVLCIAGKEKGSIFAVVGRESGRLLICDGRTRRQNKPKIKSEKHCKALNITLPGESFDSNRKLRAALRNVRTMQFKEV